MVARRFALVFSSTAVAIGAAELWTRVTADPPPDTSRAIRYVTTEGAISYEPATTFVYRTESREEVHVAIDRRGFRNPDADLLHPGTVLLLGDSFTAAVNTPEPQTVAGHLRSAGFRVVNAGVDGTGTTTHADILERRFADAVDPVVALLLFLGNDFKDNYWASPLPVVWTAAQRRRNALAAWLEGCAWAKVCTAVRDRAVVSVYQVDPMGSFPLAELIMIGEQSDHRAHAVEQTRLALERIVVGARKRLGRPIVIGVPSKAQVLRSFWEVGGFAYDPRAEATARAMVERSAFDWDQPDELAGSLAAGLGIPYVSLLQPLRAELARHSVYGSVDLHWNAAGQAVAARELLKVLGAPAPPPARSR